MSDWKFDNRPGAIARERRLNYGKKFSASMEQTIKDCFHKGMDIFGVVELFELTEEEAIRFQRKYEKDFAAGLYKFWRKKYE